jgi:plasmid stability protein
VPASKPDDERKVPLSIRVLPATKERLEAAATAHGLSLSDLHRKWLAEKLTDWESRAARGARQVTTRFKAGDPG